MSCPNCNSVLKFRSVKKKDKSYPIFYFYFHCSNKECIFSNPKNVMREPSTDKGRVLRDMDLFKASQKIKSFYIYKKMYANAKKSFDTELITVYRFDLRPPEEIKKSDGFYVKSSFQDDFYKRSSPFKFKGLQETNKSVGISTSTSLEATDLFGESFMQHIIESGVKGSDLKGYIYKINLSGQPYFKIDNKYCEINVPGKIDYNQISSFYEKSYRCSVLFDPDEILIP